MIPIPEEFSNLEEMPAEIRETLNEVRIAVVALNRDQISAITEQRFEVAGELRERAETLKRRKEKIIREWKKTKATVPSGSADAPDLRGE